MFGRDSWAQSKQLFADQFEADGDAFLYRKSQKGRPVRVSSEERQRFIDDFARRLRYGTWGTIAGILIVAGGAFWWTSTTTEYQDIATYLAIGMVAIACVGYLMRAHGAPARELARRSSVGPERTRDEMRRRLIGQASYGQFLTLALAGVALPFTFRSHPDVFHGWGRLWLVLGGGLVLLAAFAAFRKWHFDQE